MLAVLVVGALYAARRPPGGSQEVLEVSGTVEATQVDVTPRIAGRLVRVLVREGDSVRAGQVVAELDPDELEAQVAQAEAAVRAAWARWQQAQAALALQRDQLRAALRQAQAGVAAADVKVPQSRIAAHSQRQSAHAQVEQARAQLAAAEAAEAAARAQKQAVEANLEAAQAHLERAEADWRRAEQLLASGAIAAQQVDAAREAAQAARAQVEAVTQQREGAERQVEAARAAVRQARAALESVQAQRRLVQQREREVQLARSQLDQAQASLRLARIAHSHTRLQAPLGGVVVSRAAEVGDFVLPGTVVLTVADLARPYLRVFVSETDFGKLRLGQRAEVHVDAFPDRAFPAWVAEVSQKPEYTPGNVQTKEERTKLVFAVKLRVANPQGLLKPGLPADARIFVAQP
ncbi:MAG: efflux RND transporter periplasmic adaptor subunit [Armatimonadota bacterium]|nr:efflux RND transporter periplasmic adaptor subunit [Armatimonadota bacterium]MDW8156381.1 efflux RND transporter periplasmic adaptor subunit [Armatimonadota bacterium]